MEVGKRDEQLLGRFVGILREGKEVGRNPLELREVCNEGIELGSISGEEETFFVGLMVGVEVGCAVKLGARERVSWNEGLDDGGPTDPKDGLLEGNIIGRILSTVVGDLLGLLEGLMGADDGHEVGW